MRIIRHQPSLKIQNVALFSVSLGRGGARPLANGAAHSQHVRISLDCLESRQPPVPDAAISHHVSTKAHRGNLAQHIGSKITWDSVKVKITNHR